MPAASMCVCVCVLKLELAPDDASQSKFQHGIPAIPTVHLHASFFLQINATKIHQENTVMGLKQ